MTPTPQDLEEAVPADSNAAANEASSKRLSTVSKMYDINEDGELDEAELAMRKLDKSGRGYLTNDKVYAMMQEQLKMQREMFKFKKIIFGLIGLVVILALSNLGTSFASAILAKDTTTNTNNQLVGKNNGEVVATGSAVKMYTANAPSDQSSRKLSCFTNNGKATTCTITSYDQVEVDDGRQMVKECYLGATTVKFARVYSSMTKQVTICNKGGGGCTDTYYNTEGFEDPSVHPSVKLCSNGITIGPNADNSSYVILGDAATSNESEGCDSSTDCDIGLECTNNVCTVEPVEPAKDEIPVGGAEAPGSPCSSDGDCGSYVCFNTTYYTSGGTCGQCDPNNTTATGCEGTNVPSCSESYDVNGTAYGVGTCQCDVVGSTDCPAGQTCREPSCVGTSPYCAVDHDADYGCTTTTIAPKIAIEEPTVRA